MVITENFEATSPAPRYEQAISFLNGQGVVPFTEPQLDTMFEAAVAEIERGAAGIESTIPMLPTTMETVDFDKLPKGGIALTLEVGGTNVRLRYVRINEESQPEYVKDDEGREIVVEQEYASRVYNSRQEFYDTAIRMVEEGLKPLKDPSVAQSIDAIGIIFSFPFTGEGWAPEQLPKDFVIPGISQQLVGEGFMEALHRAGYNLRPEIEPVVINDVVAVMLATEGADISLVNATGYNIGQVRPVEIDGQIYKAIYNSEAGAFEHVPLSDVEAIVDSQSKNPGLYAAEKIVGGKYLAQQMAIIARQLASAGILPYKNEYKLDATDLSSIIQLGEIDKAKVAWKLQGLALTDHDESWGILTAVAGRLRLRAVEVVGTKIAAFASTIDKDVIRVPTEGSLFWKVPGYAQHVKRVAEDRLPGKTIEFVQVSGGLGAGVAALSKVA